MCTPRHPWCFSVLSASNVFQCDHIYFSLYNTPVTLCNSAYTLLPCNLAHSNLYPVSVSRCNPACTVLHCDPMYSSLYPVLVMLHTQRCVLLQWLSTSVCNLLQSCVPNMPVLQEIRPCLFKASQSVATWESSNQSPPSGRPSKTSPLLRSYTLAILRALTFTILSSLCLLYGIHHCVPPLPFTKTWLASLFSNGNGLLSDNYN